jgi:hypothetical protein
MTRQSVPFTIDGDVDYDDASSIATPTTGHRQSTEDLTLVSKTIRFFFAPYDRSRIDRLHPSDAHTKWIRLIQAAFGEDVQIISNLNRPVTNIEATSASHRAFSHAQQFKAHEKTMGRNPDTGAPKTAVVIVHRILSRVPLGQLKRYPPAYQLLKDNQCCLNEHRWDGEEWDLQQLGFVTGYNPKYYSSDRAATAFCSCLSKAQPRVKIPKFQMVLRSHRIQHNGRQSNTQAFTIEVPSHVTSQMIPILKEVMTDSKEFVTFQMRRQNPEAFQGAVRYQNHVLSTQHVIVINHVGTDAMYYLSDRIQAISGVIDVLPARKVMDTGRFYVLVDKAQIQYIRDKLTEKFDQWYRDVVPEDARPRPDQFAGPPVVGNPRSDGYSSGEESWMTNSSTSFMSYSESSCPDDSQELDRAWDAPTEVSARASNESMSPQQ